MMRVLTILLTYLLLASAAPVCAQQDLPNQASSPSPSEEPEQLKPKEGAETFVWDHAIKGEEADLNDFCRHKRLEGAEVAALHVGEEVAALHVGEEVAEGHEAEENPDPRINDERWQYPCRTIRAAFIKDILTEKNLRDKLAIQALRISGASITGPLDLTVAHIVHEVWLNQSRFEEKVKLTSAQFDRGLFFEGSNFEHGLEAERLQVKGTLNLKGATVRDEVMKLWMAKIGSNLDMGAAVFEYGIAAYDLHVGGNLYLGSRATVGGGLFLGGARIDGGLDMSTSTFKDAVESYNLNVRGDLDLREVKFTKISKKMQKVPRPMLVFDGANIGGTFNLTNAELFDCSGLDLTGAIIGGTLLLDSPQWSKGAQLILRNTRVSMLQHVDGGDHDPWPSIYHLQGFVYDRVEMLLRPSEQYVRWLDHDAPFTTQPYQQLASVFRAAGDSNRADNVLYAARDREMRESWRKGNCFYGLGGECWNAAVLFLLKCTIGYGLGLGYFWALFWVVLFTGIGTVILWRKSEDAKKNGWWWCIGASLDHLLPIVEMNKEFSDFFDRSKKDWLKGLSFAYFAIQTLIGYVLASFVVAGLAGLTQAQ